MSGTFRIAGLLTGIVLALALIGPAVFADSNNVNQQWLDSFNQDNDPQTNEASLAAGAQNQSQSAPVSQSSANSASEFGNNNRSKAANNTASGAVTVMGPKLVLLKTSTQSANSSANGNNSGGPQTQTNVSAAGSNGGARTALGGNANVDQGAIGGTSGDALAQNYTGAHQTASATNSTDRGGGNTRGGNGGDGGAGNGGAASGGAGNGGGLSGSASGGTGGDANASAITNRSIADSCNNGDANANSNASSSNTNATASGSPDCNGASNANAGASGGNGGTARAANNSNAGDGTGGDATAGNGTGGSGGNGGNPDGGANGRNVGVAKNENSADNSGDTKAWSGDVGSTRNVAIGNDGGRAVVAGDQEANGGNVKDNTQFQIVGNKGGDATNVDVVYFTSDWNVTATTGAATNSGNAESRIPVINRQDASNASSIDLDQTQRIRQELSQTTSGECCPDLVTTDGIQ
jgi:hypothetical protein